MNVFVTGGTATISSPVVTELLASDHTVLARARSDSAEGLAAAITALGKELIASDGPIVTVSGTPWVPGRASTEDDPLPLQGPVAGRARSVNSLLDLASAACAPPPSGCRAPSTTRVEADSPPC